MRPNKRLGQHFLTDPGILNRIADALDLQPGETVIEVGPGRGSLTEVLLARGAKVIAIEKDARLVDARFVQGDALHVDWHALVTERFKVVGNIPYNITSPLIEKALTPPLPERIVFLVQLEVAQRLAAPPGSKTYGGLSIGVQAQCRVEQLFTVQPGSFRPAPKVKSALVRLTPLAEPLVRPEEVAPFRAFVTACFSKRRKQLKNVVPGRDLIAMGFDPTVRPERLAPEAFVRLFRGAPA